MIETFQEYDEKNREYARKIIARIQEKQQTQTNIKVLYIEGSRRLEYTTTPERVERLIKRLSKTGEVMVTALKTI